MIQFFQSGGLVGNVNALPATTLSQLTDLKLASELSGPITSVVAPTVSKAFGSGLNNSLFKGGPSIGAVAGMGIDLVNNFLPLRSEYSGDKGGITKGMDQAYDQVANAVAMIPGWGTAASLIMKGGAGLGKVVGKLGGGTDGMTGVDAVLGSSFLNLTPLGLINGFGGQKTSTVTKDNQVWEKQGSSYGGTLKNLDDAVHKSGKKYGLFSSGARKKANDLINDMRNLQNTISNINNEAQDRFAAQASMADPNERRYSYSILGGYKGLAVGKNGMKLFNKEQIERARRAIEYQPIKVEWIAEFLDKPQSFKNGGAVNVIPEGALHARLNHMEVDNITKKGIPVVVKKEGGEVEQQAEVECNEIIFHLELTKKLEELAKQYKETEDDKYAIEAGKLLSHEIMENTDDRTGLIKQVS